MHPGFATGDDVEIHEMTLRTLLGKDWPIWDLRSAFYPFTVVYPAQALAHLFGADVQALVVAGRATVALASTAAVWLTWVAAKPMLGEGLAAIAAALVAISKLHLVRQLRAASSRGRHATRGGVCRCCLERSRSRPRWRVVA